MTAFAGQPFELCTSSRNVRDVAKPSSLVTLASLGRHEKLPVRLMQTNPPSLLRSPIGQSGGPEDGMFWGRGGAFHSFEKRILQGMLLLSFPLLQGLQLQPSHGHMAAD